MQYALGLTLYLEKFLTVLKSSNKSDYATISPESLPSLARAYAANMKFPSFLLQDEAGVRWFLKKNDSDADVNSFKRERLYYDLARHLGIAATEIRPISSQQVQEVFPELPGGDYYLTRVVVAGNLTQTGVSETTTWESAFSRQLLFDLLAGNLDPHLANYAFLKGDSGVYPVEIDHDQAFLWDEYPTRNFSTETFLTDFLTHKLSETLKLLFKSQTETTTLYKKFYQNRFSDIPGYLEQNPEIGRALLSAEGIASREEILENILPFLNLPLPVIHQYAIESGYSGQALEELMVYIDFRKRNLEKTLAKYFDILHLPPGDLKNQLLSMDENAAFFKRLPKSCQTAFIYGLFNVLVVPWLEMSTFLNMLTNPTHPWLQEAFLRQHQTYREGRLASRVAYQVTLRQLLAHAAFFHNQSQMLSLLAGASFGGVITLLLGINHLLASWVLGILPGLAVAWLASHYQLPAVVALAWQHGRSNYQALNISNIQPGLSRRLFPENAQAIQALLDNAKRSFGYNQPILRSMLARLLILAADGCWHLVKMLLTGSQLDHPTTKIHDLPQETLALWRATLTRGMLESARDLPDLCGFFYDYAAGNIRLQIAAANENPWCQAFGAMRFNKTTGQGWLLIPNRLLDELNRAKTEASRGHAAQNMSLLVISLYRAYSQAVRSELKIEPTAQTDWERLQSSYPRARMAAGNGQTVSFDGYAALKDSASYHLNATELILLIIQALQIFNPEIVNEFKNELESLWKLAPSTPRWSWLGPIFAREIKDRKFHSAPWLAITERLAASSLPSQHQAITLLTLLRDSMAPQAASTGNGTGARVVTLDCLSQNVCQAFGSLIAQALEKELPGKEPEVETLQLLAKILQNMQKANGKEFNLSARAEQEQLARLLPGLTSLELVANPLLGAWFGSYMAGAIQIQEKSINGVVVREFWATQAENASATKACEMAKGPNAEMIPAWATKKYLQPTEPLWKILFAEGFLWFGRGLELLPGLKLVGANCVDYGLKQAPGYFAHKLESIFSKIQALPGDLASTLAGIRFATDGATAYSPEQNALRSAAITMLVEPSPETRADFGLALYHALNHRGSQIDNHDLWAISNLAEKINAAGLLPKIEIAKNKQGKKYYILSGLIFSAAARLFVTEVLQNNGFVLENLLLQELKKMDQLRQQNFGFQGAA
jgi:hypothetical protein